MIKAAITGNIASGKSQAENILISLGFKVIDCDKINSMLLNRDKTAAAEIKNCFGSSVLNSDGSISKQLLAEIVFSSAEKKRLLEDIMHKRILQEVNKFFEINKKEKIVFVSAALLFEAGWQNMFDKIIFVSADEKLRAERLMQRSSLTREQALMRIKSQNIEAEKIQKSDFIIYNNSGLEALKQAVLNILRSLEV